MQDLGKSKSFFAAACFGVGLELSSSGIAAVWALDQRNCWGLERFQLYDIALGLLVPFSRSGYSLLAKATNPPVPNRERVQRAASHLQSPPHS